jgi:hypothetical protein
MIMSEPFSVLIWQWYDEKDKVRAVFALGDALTNLALSPDDKVLHIPDCPFCELVYPYFSAEEDILKNCRPGIRTELVESINELSQLIKNLPSQEALCCSRDIFGMPTWNRITHLARQTLELLEWTALLDDRSALEG